MDALDLSSEERIHLRDRLRSARYSALADAEGFLDVCYAIESLGMRLHGVQGTLHDYWPAVRKLADYSPVFKTLPGTHPELFTRFDALYETLRRARNDAMHTGSYARHAASAAIELCIGLEESLMNAAEAKIEVADYMVKTPVSIEVWQPVAYARQLMLMHSYSFLPIKYDGQWKLLSELAVVGFLYPMSRVEKAVALAKSITTAVSEGLTLLPVEPLLPSHKVAELVSLSGAQPTPTLWLVVDPEKGLTGVLSPFELM